MGKSGRRRAGPFASEELFNGQESGRNDSSDSGEPGRIKFKKIRKMKSALNYNEDQKKVIAFNKGSNLVSAGPGSGKTRVVVARIARMIQDGINPKSILATTFTRKAADEMNERLRSDGVNTKTGVAVKTLHGFCYTMVIKRSHLADWKIDENDDYNFLIKMTIGYKNMKWHGADLSYVAGFISLAKNSLIRPEQSLNWPVLQQEPFYGDKRYAQAYFETEELRKQRKLLTFDDMLIDAVEILETDETLREQLQTQYEYVIVDEFQDTNLAQVRLVELVSEPQWNLMAVGDTDQCQPAGTMVTTPNGQVPIENLKDGDRVTTWNRHAGRIVGNEEIKITSRNYSGYLYSIKAGPYQTDATDNHHWFVRWNREHEIWVTYLMYREELGYRIGWCKLFTNKTRTYHLAQRARIEKAEKAWIIGIHDSSQEASIAESIIAARYGIPTVMFEPKNAVKHYTRKALNKIFEAVCGKPNSTERSSYEVGNIVPCLNRYLLSLDHPIYERGKHPVGGQQRGTIFITRSCNLIPELMSVPTANGWLPIDVRFRKWHGVVYSLNVEKHHSYVADGIVTHNCIYEWRGAVPSFMLEFAEKYKATITSMGTNYRCAPNIMKAAANCIKHNEKRIDKKLAANKTEEATIKCKEVYDLDTESRLVADEIQMLAEDINYGDIYVLFRTNAQSRAIEEEFCRRKIPHVILGAASFYQRKEVQDLLAYLKLLDNPYDAQAGARCINRPFRFVSKKIVDDISSMVNNSTTFMQAAKEIAGKDFGGRGIIEFISLMDKLESILTIGDKTKPGEILSIIVKDSDYINYLTNNEGSDTAENSRAANVGELLRAADRYTDIKGLLKFVDWQIKQRKKNQKNKPSNVVQGMTIHKAKGLEAKAVFVIGCNEGILPHAKSAEDCEEERRLFYVAVTRAMEYLMLSCVQRLGLDATGELEPSRFIDEAEIEIERSNEECTDATDVDQSSDPT